MSDIDEQDAVDSRHKTAVLSAALGGDTIAHYACSASLADIKTVSNYPEPQGHNEALASSDAENWAEAMKKEFNSMKRTELLTDPQ